MFNEREKFVMMMTAMVTSEKAKEQPREVRQKILAFMRDKYCSSVDDESWAQIAKDINETKELLMSETMKYLVSSMSNDGSMKEDKAAMELEETVKEHKDEIDLDELKEDTQDIGVKQIIDEIKEAEPHPEEPMALAEKAYEEAKAEEFKPSPKDSKEIDRQFEEMRKKYDDIQKMARDIDNFKTQIKDEPVVGSWQKTVEEKRVDEIEETVKPKKKKKYDFFGRKVKDKEADKVEREMKKREGGGKKRWFRRN